MLSGSHAPRHRLCSRPIYISLTSYVRSARPCQEGWIAAAWSFDPSGNDFLHRPIVLGEAPGPRDTWRVMGDETAYIGNTLSLVESLGDGVSPEFPYLWFCWITLEATEPPRAAALDDSPPARNQPFAARAKLDRLSDGGKILWCPKWGHPGYSRVCPSLPLAPPDKIRMVRGRPNPSFGLKGILVNPNVDYGISGGRLSVLRPGAYVAGLDLQDCFLRW